MSNEPTMTLRAWWTMLGACAIAATFTVIMFNRQSHPAPEPTVTVTVTTDPRIESYPACPGGTLTRDSVPCVREHTGGLYTLVRGVFVDGQAYEETMTACRTEDSAPAGMACVWDTATRGNGQAGPGVFRFLVNRQ